MFVSYEKCCLFAVALLARTAEHPTNAFTTTPGGSLTLGLSSTRTATTKTTTALVRQDGRTLRVRVFGGWLGSTTTSSSLPSYRQQKQSQQLRHLHSTLGDSEIIAIDAGGDDSEYDSSNVFVDNNNDIVISIPQKQRKSKATDGDIPFLRKRTTELLRATHSSAWQQVAAKTAQVDASDMQKQPSDAANTGHIIGSKMKIGLKTFNYLIGAWVNSGESDSAEQAVALLRRMEELHQAKKGNVARKKQGSNPVPSPPCPFDVSPDARSYTKTINALARSSLADAGTVAETILKRMDALYSGGSNTAAKPNRFTYLAVIEAYAHSGEPHTAEHIEELCDTMLQKFYDGDDDMKPSARCFNCAIIALAKSGLPGAAKRAEAVLDRMIDLSKDPRLNISPTTASYNSLITAWANTARGQSAEHAEAVLSKMEEEFLAGNRACQPSTVSYNAVINAYAKSGEPGSAQHAEDVLKRMQECRYDTVTYNTRSFNSVMNAWARSREPGAELKAEALLKYMTRLSQEGNTQLQPDVHSYSIVINAWGRSQSYGKAAKANELFEEMLALYEAGNKSARPNVVVFNAVLNACAYTNEATDDLNAVMEIAQKRMKQLEVSDFGSPDQVTYGTFLKICSNLMSDPESLEQVTELIFKKCCRDGQMGDLVLRQIRQSASPELFEKLVSRSNNEDVTVNDLPIEWRSNVVEGKWKRARRNSRT